MDKKTLEALGAPFPASEIRQRRGSFGTVKYVDGARVIQRLNDSFEGNWSFEVVEYKFLENEVLVLGRLTAGGVTKMAFGGSQITRSRDSGEPVSLVDDAKSAAMDATKKIASWFNVCLEQCYCDANPAESSNTAKSKVRRPANDGNGRSQQPVNAGNGNRHQAHQDRITIKQLGLLNSLAKRAHYTADQIRDKAVDMFGVPPERLTKSQASTIIEDLSDELGGTAAA